MSDEEDGVGSEHRNRNTRRLKKNISTNVASSQEQLAIQLKITR